MNKQYSYPYYDEWTKGEFLSGNALFDEERFCRSEQGRHLARARSLMATYDMPIINVAGTAEFNGIFPINRDAPGVPEDSPYRKTAFPMTKENRVRDWKVRLEAMRCPVPADEVIYAAGRNKAEAVLGFPCDRTDLLYAQGSECYIGDVKNVDGRYHFRTVAIENVPHTTTRLMHILTWSWVRRFARDLTTGAVVELWDI